MAWTGTGSVQHYPAEGKFSARLFWATVNDLGTCAIAKIWTPGCGFSPKETTHVTMQLAKEYAEAQLAILSR